MWEQLLAQLWLPYLVRRNGPLDQKSDRGVVGERKRKTKIMEERMTEKQQLVERVLAVLCNFLSDLGEFWERDIFF